MFLNEVMPSMDTENGSITSFSFTQSELRPMFWIYIELDPDNPKKEVLLDIRVLLAEQPNELELNELSYCEEIRELIAQDRLEQIILCIIDGFRYWNKNEQEVLLCTKLREDTKAIVALKKNGTGIIQIANNAGVFVEPLKVPA